MRVVVLGSGGHAAVVVDILKMLSVDVVAALDADRRRWGSSLLDVEVRGDDTLLPRLREEGATHALVAVGDNRLRREISTKAVAAGFQFATAVHPSASVSRHAELGAGSVVMPVAAINARTMVGQGAIVNTGASVDHDCVIGDFVHVAPGARIGGGVRVGSGTLVGIGSTLMPYITIGDDAVIGAGAVVIHDVESGSIVVGNPAQRIRRG